MGEGAGSPAGAQLTPATPLGLVARRRAEAAARRLTPPPCEEVTTATTSRARAVGFAVPAGASPPVGGRRRQQSVTNELLPGAVAELERVAASVEAGQRGYAEYVAALEADRARLERALGAERAASARLERQKRAADASVSEARRSAEEAQRAAAAALGHRGGGALVLHHQTRQPLESPRPLPAAVGDPRRDAETFHAAAEEYREAYKRAAVEARQNKALADALEAGSAELVAAAAAAADAQAASVGIGGRAAGMAAPREQSLQHLQALASAEDELALALGVLERRPRDPSGGGAPATPRTVAAFAQAADESVEAIRRAHAVARTLSGLAASEAGLSATSASAAGGQAPASQVDVEQLLAEAAAREAALRAELAERDAAEDVLEERLRQVADATRERAEAFEAREAQLASREREVAARWEELRRAMATAQAQGGGQLQLGTALGGLSPAAARGDGHGGAEGSLDDLLLDAEAARSDTAREEKAAPHLAARLREVERELDARRLASRMEVMAEDKGAAALGFGEMGGTVTIPGAAAAAWPTIPTGAVAVFSPSVSAAAAAAAKSPSGAAAAADMMSHAVSTAPGSAATPSALASPPTLPTSEVVDAWMLELEERRQMGARVSELEGVNERLRNDAAAAEASASKLRESVAEMVEELMEARAAATPGSAVTTAGSVRDRELASAQSEAAALRHAIGERDVLVGRLRSQLDAAATLFSASASPKRLAEGARRSPMLMWGSGTPRSSGDGESVRRRLDALTTSPSQEAQQVALAASP